MSAFPPLHELIWLFEADPIVEDADLGWPVGPYAFETERGSWRVRCVIAPYDYTVTIRCQIGDEDAIEVNLLENVDEVRIDRTHGCEALEVICRAGSRLRPVRLQLKPRILVSVETMLSWQQTELPLGVLDRAPGGRQSALMTEVLRSADYEGPALDWLYTQVERLRAALARAGVTDESVQRSVCDDFFFGLSVEFDDGEVVDEPRPRRRLAFESEGALLLPDDRTFDMHDYALGVVGEAFGDA